MFSLSRRRIFSRFLMASRAAHRQLTYMKIAYFDCFSGISGDMTLGALVDAGCDLAEIESYLRRLPISRLENFGGKSVPPRFQGHAGSKWSSPIRSGTARFPPSFI